MQHKFPINSVAAELMDTQLPNQSSVQRQSVTNTTEIGGSAVGTTKRAHISMMRAHGHNIDGVKVEDISAEEAGIKLASPNEDATVLFTVGMHADARDCYLKNGNVPLTQRPNAYHLNTSQVYQSGLRRGNVNSGADELRDTKLLKQSIVKLTRATNTTEVRGSAMDTTKQAHIPGMSAHEYNTDCIKVEDISAEEAGVQAISSNEDATVLFTVDMHADAREGQLKNGDLPLTQRPNAYNSGTPIRSIDVSTGEKIGTHHARKRAEANLWDPCVVPPAPHASDGGTMPTPIGSSVFTPVVKIKESKSVPTVKLPSVRERREARKSSNTIAFAVKSSANPGAVYLSEEQAVAHAETGDDIRKFDEYDTAARNIKSAHKWLTQPVFNSNASVFVPSQNRKPEKSKAQDEYLDRQEEKHDIHHEAPAASVDIHHHEGRCCKHRVAPALKTDSPAFTPADGKLHLANEDAWPTVRQKTPSEQEQSVDISLRQLLKHKQVSHVRNVRKDTSKRMDTFATCNAPELVMDFRGTTAGRIQRQLRKSLVADLANGTDTAAFVCSQLGIDNAPRCDQLELLIAAMPGVASIKFEGPPAESGLNIDEWIKGHVGHCDTCKEGTIMEDCYFKIMHHFMLRGFDPQLKQGRAWEELKTRTEAYIKLWHKDPRKNEEAWTKWKNQAACLLSEQSNQEPALVIPLLPTTRAKQMWRFHKDGTPYKVRLCLDLKSAAVNEALADWRFKYRGLDDIATRLKKGDWLASVDISRFYLRLPAGPNLRKVQWVQDPDTYAATQKHNRKSKRRRWRQLLAIGFGLKTAPAWASAVSAELVRILESNGVRVVGCFIDDILIAAESKEKCAAALERAINIMMKLGVPANEKTVPPQSPEQGIVFLGMHIRTSDMRFTVSKEHRLYAIDRLKQVLSDRSATKRQLASIAGVLTWISYVFLPGKPRRQHIYYASSVKEGGDKSEKVEIKGSLRAQLRWWLNVLKQKRFKGTRVWSLGECPRSVLMESDASGEDGWGACTSGFHLVGPWPEELKDASMLFKELVPMMITLALMAAQLPETVFAAATDNTGSAFAVNRLTCRDRISRRLLQQMSHDLEAGGHTAIASHVYRHRNEHADELSHALLKVQWQRIEEEQKRQSQRDDKFWIFPFVAHCMKTGEMYSARFRMRKDLFSSAH